MSKPTILAVDDDPGVSRAIARDLRARYGADYQVVSTNSGQEALELLAQLALRDRTVALVVSDQGMPGMTGIELLEQVRQESPESRLLLLTAYADTGVAIKAINDIGLDYYLLKPWDPPDERLYPVVDDLLSSWREEHPDEEAQIRVIGHRWSDQSYEVKTFLTHNHVPYRWLDVERDEEATHLLELAEASAEDLPLVLVPDGEALRSPSPLQMADALGLRTRPEQPLYDLCIVGDGPAGLAAAVYAASEGLRTVVVERDAPGGQAGQSASIENYLGFPKGLSGAELTHRAVAQAARFGAETVLARDVVGFETRGPVRAVRLDGQGEIEARACSSPPGCPIAASTCPASTRSGCAASTTAHRQRGHPVQGRGRVRRRGGELRRSGSAELLPTCQARGDGGPRSPARGPHVAVPRLQDPGGGEHRGAAAHRGRRARGEGHLEAITLADRETGTEREVGTSWLFVFIGMSPRTGWLGDDIVRDPKGFVVTGQDMMAAEGPGKLAAPPAAVRPGDQRPGRLRCR